LFAPAAEFAVAFDLPGPWGGARYGLRTIRLSWQLADLGAAPAALFNYSKFLFVQGIQRSNGIPSIGESEANQNAGERRA
jgi:hypothetical protein